MLTINAQTRDQLGTKHSKRLRKQMMLPCVVYSKECNLPIKISKKDLNLITLHHQETLTIHVQDQAFQVKVKEIKIHPVTEDILHIDFQVV